MENLINLFIQYSELILSLFTAIILLTMFYIKKKIKIRRLKKMRTKEYLLTEEESKIIDDLRAKQFTQFQKEDIEELNRIFKIITPEALDLIKKLPLIKKIFNRNEDIQLPKSLTDLKNILNEGDSNE